MAIVALVVCLLAIVVILLAKKAFGGIGGGGFKTRAPRLAVMDVARIDEKRRLVLVRRDEVEHLVLVGGQTDILLEGNILRVPAARSRTEPQLDRLPDPDDAPAARRWDAPSNGDERQSRPHVAPPPAPARHEPRHGAQNGDTNAPEPRTEAAPSPVATPAPAPVVAPPRPAAPKRDAAPLPDARRPEAEAVRLPPRPPVPPAPPVQPRSMATPTLPAAQREEAAARQPTPAASSQSTGRIEPSLAMPDPQPTPDMSRQRAELRERLSRSPSTSLPRAPAASAPVVTLDKPAEAALERRPLSVRSFATAIQNRGAPLDVQAPVAPPKPAIAPPVAAAPPVVPVQPAASRDEPAGVATQEPSLEDFLSAELDLELSRDDAPEVSSDAATPSRPEADNGPASAPQLTEPVPQPISAATTTVEPAPEPKRQSTPPAANAESPARKLTLEEEMERLLGDFSFGESDRRDRG
ncbi:hypothetical protein GTW51_00610 [Aurantimonas aggregata]|uniref:Flagellar biosynthesis protein FliO n=1 Tax=Aurantimonas aggregata TaxID=2047720 RepID=A0A6L9MC02_9HYPH|nr:hypothetical protein [Aurantimonas aggregata]